MLTQYQKLRLLTAAGMEGPSRKAVMGMEERENLPGSRGKRGTQRGESEGRVEGAGSKQGKLRDGVKEGGARHLAIILGHLAERGALGVPRAWGAPCGSQTSARPRWCGKGVSSCSPVLPPPPHHPVVFSFKVPKCLDFL